MKNKAKIEEMICEEIDSIGEKSKLSAGDLETLYKLVMIGSEIGDVGESKYSERYWDDMNSYAPYRRRDSMGRYSRNDARSMLMAEMGEAMNYAENEHQREIIRKAMNQLDK